MLIPADANLAASDSQLPGLDLLLDTDQVLAALKPELSVDWHELNLTANYIRYKRSTSCLVGFAGSYRQRPIHLYARLHQPGEVAKATKPLLKPLAPSHLGPGGLQLKKPCLLFMFFPNDHELKVVRKLEDPAFRNECLRHLLSGGKDVECSDLTLLRYKPERRWVGLVQMGTGHQFLLKAHARKFPLSTTTCLQDQLRTANFHVRPRIGTIPSQRLALYRWIPGTPLGPDAEPDQLRRIGRQLAQLHCQNHIALVPLAIPADEALEVQLRTALDAIADIAPDQIARTEDMRETILRLWYAQPHTVTKIRCSIHGDFSSDQIIMDGEQPWFIDFDRTSISHPVHDLGSFLARLHHDQICGIRSDASLAAHSQALVRGYGEACSVPVADLVVPSLALQLLKLAPEAFRHRAPDWSDHLNQVLNRVGQILALKGDPDAA